MEYLSNKVPRKRGSEIFGIFSRIFVVISNEVFKYGREIVKTSVIDTSNLYLAKIPMARLAIPSSFSSSRM